MPWRERVYQWFVHALFTACGVSDVRSEYPTGRFLRDARLYTVGAGTQEIRRMLIGREFNNDYKS